VSLVLFQFDRNEHKGYFTKNARFLLVNLVLLVELGAFQFDHKEHKGYFTKSARFILVNLVLLSELGGSSI